MIGERTYSYQSALPYLQATQLPATVTLAGGLTDIFFPDMADKIANMDPCPNTLFVKKKKKWELQVYSIL